MECFTVQEVAKKWGISIRRVQYLCNHDMIPGAVRFGKVWTIPKETEKPKDGRCKKNKEIHNNIVQPFQSLCGNEEMLSKIIEYFPYPIHVYAPDGTMILTNEACLMVMHISSKDKIVGKFNVLKDPIIDKWGSGVKECISRSFQGETVQFHDLKMPVQNIIDKFGKEEICFDISFQDITCFPIYDDNLQLVYVVNVFITSRLYRGKEEIIKGKEYIESHWKEELDADVVAKVSGLSKTQFTRLFKTHTGFTPHDYYVSIKISMIKKKLLDFNLSISQAFSECGIDYNGHFAKIFKDLVGITPSEYRRNNS